MAHSTSRPVDQVNINHHLPAGSVIREKQDSQQSCYSALILSLIIKYGKRQSVFQCQLIGSGGARWRRSRLCRLPRGGVAPARGLHPPQNQPLTLLIEHTCQSSYPQSINQSINRSCQRSASTLKPTTINTFLTPRHSTDTFWVLRSHFPTLLFEHTCQSINHTIHMLLTMKLTTSGCWPRTLHRPGVLS